MITANGVPLDKQTTEAALEHYGVKGMKWGVRRSEEELAASRRTRRMAGKDAKEFVEAKAYYGEGAGTRRKLIKQRVEGRRKKYPGYGEAFDRAVGEQDTDRAVTKATRKRKRTDAANTTKKTGKAVARSITGQAGNAAAAVALGTIGYRYLQSNPQMRSALTQSVTSATRSAARNASRVRRNIDLNVLGKNLYLDPNGGFYTK